MALIDFVEGGIEIDARVLAEAFGIETDDLRQRMREGAITSRFERGEDADAGTVRLTFFSPGRRVTIIADESGNVLSCRTVNITRAPPSRSKSRAQDAGNNGPLERVKEKAAMSDTLYPTNTGALAQRRKDLTPEAEAAFKAFSQAVFAEGALDAKTKQLIAVAVAHVTQCPYCIKGHTKAALRHEASEAEVMEAIWVAAEMRAGAAFAHSALALAETEKAGGKD